MSLVSFSDDTFFESGFGGWQCLYTKYLIWEKMAANISFIIVAKTLIVFKYDTTCI